MVKGANPRRFQRTPVVAICHLLGGLLIPLCLWLKESSVPGEATHHYYLALTHCLATTLSSAKPTWMALSPSFQSMTPPVAPVILTVLSTVPGPRISSTLAFVMPISILS